MARNVLDVDDGERRTPNRDGGHRVFHASLTLAEGWLG